MLIESPFWHERDTTLHFLHTDTEKLFQHNLKRLPSDWYWRDKTITYKLNRLGRRMNKEVEEVNFDNYFAFFGCSYTVGIGLPLEETFAYRISQIENVDYINSAIGGGSIEFVLADLIRLFSNAPKYPKVVFISWPDCIRTMYWKHNGVDFYLPSNFEHLPFKHLYRQFLLASETIDQRITYVVETARLICKLSNVKLVEFTISQPYPSFYQNLNVPVMKEVFQQKHMNIRYARDVDKKGAHPGLTTQEEIISFWCSM